MISSPANPAVKRVRRLRKAMWRQRTGLVLVEGERAVRAAVEAGRAREVFHLSLTGRRAQLLAAAKSAGAEVRPVSPEVMVHWTGHGTAPSVLATATDPLVPLEAVRASMMILSAVRDPATAGELLATAAAAGFGGAAFCRGSVDPSSPKVLRAAGGAHFRIGVAAGVSEKEAAARATEQGARLIELSAGGSPAATADLRGPVGLVVAGAAADAIADAEPVEVLPEAPLAARAAALVYEWVRQQESQR